jgi:hypothetical protein
MKAIFAWFVILAGLLGGWVFFTSSALVSLLASTSGIILLSGFTLGHLILAIVVIGDWIIMTIAAYSIHPNLGDMFVEIGLRVPYICYYAFCVSQKIEPAKMPKFHSGEGGGGFGRGG